VTTTRTIFLSAPLALALMLQFPSAARASDFSKIVGPEKCAECHKSESEAWKTTHHYETFDSMHRTPRAQAIAEKLGLQSIKRDSVCLNCHYTEQGSGGTAIAGVSCESCHGAAADWIDVHADYGGKDATKESESAEHRKNRIAQSVAKGMNRPDQIVALAGQCFRCHNVPQEKLVNVGGHQPGSNFELVSWTEGEVRHNFLNSKTNVEDSPQRKRVLYVVGQGLALSTNMRDVGLATEKATFAVSMARRAAAATANLKKVDEAVKIPEVEQMLEISGKAELKLNNQQALSASANQVEEAVRKFAASNDGSNLAALDALIPDSSTYKGQAFQK
jgi:cytochrome c554/c'-like protein